MGKYLEVKGAGEHNLKNVSLKLPRNEFIVITGVSGSGKSSLAFDTIFQEGQRRYIESLSSYARQFIGQVAKPKIDHISGLSPTICIDQKTVNRNPRSTVGTITGLYDFFRLLYARLGEPHCPSCGDRIQSQTVDQISDRLQLALGGKEILILAPVVRQRKGEYRKEQEDLKEKGFHRARIDGKWVTLEKVHTLDRYVQHNIDVVIDKIKIEDQKIPRLKEGLERAIQLTKSLVGIVCEEAPSKEWEEVVFSTQMSCPKCNISLPEFEPRLFSFNNPQGACKVCDGLGVQRHFDVSLVVPDQTKSILEGAIACITDNGNIMFSQWGQQELEILAKNYQFSLETPWNKLTAKAKQIILYGSPEELDFELLRQSKWNAKVSKESRRIRGVMEVLQRVWDQWHIPLLEKFMQTQVCTSCQGKRLTPEALAVVFHGRNIHDLSNQSISEAIHFFTELPLTASEKVIGREILKEIKTRLGFLQNVGLSYLTLNRTATTLSGGEGQRIRLAAQVGAGLQGVLYVLDEPSIGLHSRDNLKLLQTLKALRDLGNTLLVVEHDEETMAHCDYLVDVGPGAGVLGGEIIAQGRLTEFLKNKKSITASYLNKTRSIKIPSKRRSDFKKWLVLKGAKANNLKGIDVSIPLEVFVCITGVSGSGKSTLVDETLRKALAKILHHNGEEPGQYTSLEGVQHLKRLVEISQAPIGRTPRSNPVTYTGVFDSIRDLFASLPEAKLRGYKKGQFSFNVKAGRCEACAGSGIKEIEMQLLMNVSLPCPECGGKRFNEGTLEIHYKGKNIHEVLETSVSEAVDFFENQPKISRGLQMLRDIGLGYIKLGQSSTTLSGGEAQRIKLATELQKQGTTQTMYILDEPTTGLHFLDIEKLLDCLQGLVDRGNTVVVIEHNLDVIKSADYLIDLGPEGGKGGGEIIATGTPEDVAKSPNSYTGQALKTVLLDLKPSAKKSDTKVKVSEKSVSLLNTDTSEIAITRAYKHNLKNVSLEIPHGKMTVVTGVSGSGKSSLAFHTLFAEGQRRFLESLSTYARRFLGRVDKGEVDEITGLAPAIAIDQSHANRSAKSTVATTTEIYDYFRILYARLGHLYCPTCSVRLETYQPSTALKFLQSHYMGQTITLLAPLYLAKVEHDFYLENSSQIHKAAEILSAAGFSKVWHNGQMYSLEKIPEIEKHDSIYLYIDRIEVQSSKEARLRESYQVASEKGHGIVSILNEKGEHRLLSSLSFCPHGHFFSKEAIEPKHFSFNSHWGACTHCQGLGTMQTLVATKVFPDTKKPILGGGIAGRAGKKVQRPGGYYRSILKKIFKSWGYSAEVSFSELSKNHKQLFLQGLPEPFVYSKMLRGKSTKFHVNWDGLFPLMQKWYSTNESPQWQEEKETFTEVGPCHHCQGTRLKAPYNKVTVGEINIGELTAYTIEKASNFFQELKFSKSEQIVAESLLREIQSRLRFLSEVGLGYLSLDREAHTLSGGEAQRIRLASQIGSGLEGVLYVLDEPTIGLHPQDTGHLLKTLQELRDLGNTLVLVEHDPEIIRAADYIVDMGPQAGEGGGRIMARGTLKQILGNSQSLTGMYLSGKKIIGSQFKTVESQAEVLNTSQTLTHYEIPTRTTVDSKKNKSSKLISKIPHLNSLQYTPKGHFQISGLNLYNLRDFSANIPIGGLVVLCGVSGSGKSSLYMEAAAGAIQKILQREKPTESTLKVHLTTPVDELILVDQSPLGSSPRSNPITYGKIFDLIRELFARTPDARLRGYTKSRFSMNTGNGRCTVCEGMGQVKIEMHFLSDVWVECDQCKGNRFNDATLKVQYKGRTIADVLKMRVQEALPFFNNHKKVSRYLEILQDIGLGYIRLGQSSTTFSGGEAQRIKIAGQISKVGKKHNLYILDEPTTGLHLADIEMLYRSLRKLTEAGHTVWVIEHHLDIIRNADHVIELGVDANRNAKIVFQGSPQDLANAKTPTGRYLK